MMRRTGLQKHHSLPSLESSYPDSDLLISCLAFMDDTDWIARNRENLQKIIDIAMSFFTLHGIEINPKKSELIVINPTCDELWVEIGENRVSALPPGTSARVLGVWFSADGKGTHTRQLIKQELSTICSILSRKAVTDKQTIYIFNNVFLPRILYRLSVTVLRASEVKTI
ncbi:hypothetical protein BGX23_005581, partial [Mortierella sp. AD031]